LRSRSFTRLSHTVKKQAFNHFTGFPLEQWHQLKIDERLLILFVKSSERFSPVNRRRSEVVRVFSKKTLQLVLPNRFANLVRFAVGLTPPEQTILVAKKSERSPNISA
jgi:hypothetical protein